MACQVTFVIRWACDFYLMWTLNYIVDDDPVALQDTYLWHYHLADVLPWELIPLEKYFYVAFLNKHLFRLGD